MHKANFKNIKNNSNQSCSSENYVQNIYHTLDEKETFLKLSTSFQGLTEKEAEKRRQQYGLNELQKGEEVSPWKIFFGQFNSPLIWILFFAVIVSFFLKEYFDAAIIIVIIVANALFGFLQEYRAEKSIEALQKLAALKTTVLRQGKKMQMDSKLLVPGDLIFLEEGEKIPADCRLIESIELETQEAALTGESLPIHKVIVSLPEKTILAERKNMVYSGTIVTSGRGKAIVTTTGMKTEVGKIAQMIGETHTSETPLQKKLAKLGQYLTIGVIIIAIIIFGTGVFNGEPYLTMFLTAVALAVAAIPEGLPAVITISLAIGVQKMLNRHALIRKLPAVETLGSVSVICTDKTGTLTHNEMTVTKIWSNNLVYDVTGTGYNNRGEFKLNENNDNKFGNEQAELALLLKIGVLCNNAQIEREKSTAKIIGDPTEAALLVATEKAGYVLKKLTKDEPRVLEIPFSSERKMMTTIHQIKSVKGDNSKGDNNKKVSYSKGSPDIILNSCNRIYLNHKIQPLNAELKKKIQLQNESFSQQALRVLAFAYNNHFRDKKEAERGMIFVGLQAMIDPPREEVKVSLQKCHEAGIRVIMITGDQLTTAQAIAKELGITGKAISGEELEAKIKKNKNYLVKEIENINIFARVNPEHKLEIVQALKKKGYLVAMTGDGVNDAPALKKADIGIAMGITGTDVAKEASMMILTDDNFTSIVNAIEEGRIIFNNIKKFVNYLLSSNLGEITAIFFASILRLPLPLTAIQILWVNLVTDGLPAVALSVDPSVQDVMKSPPRPAKENIIDKKLREDIILFGVLIGLGTLFFFWYFLDRGLLFAQTAAFNALVLFEIARLQMIRSQYHLSIWSNKWLLAAVSFSLILQLVVVYTPLNTYFGVVPLSWKEWSLLIIGALGLFFIHRIFWLVRRLFKKIVKRK